jgi:hypothetical protein
MDNNGGADRIYIREAAELLNRRMATLRKWEQVGDLPEHLRPHRGERGWRYWTPDQIEGIKQWMKTTDRRPGKGLPHFNPTEKQIEQAFSNMRRPRRCVLCEGPITKKDRYTRLRGKPVHLECSGVEDKVPSDSGATV